MTYTYSLTIIDDDGNIVVDHTLTPDQAVAILAGALTERRAVQSEPEIEEESKPGRRKNATAPFPKAKGKRKCSNCGKPGHIARHCPGAGLKRPIGPHDDPKPKPLTGDQYDELRDAMHDRDFSSAEHALSNKLPPREINAAVRSTDYDDYLDNR